MTQALLLMDLQNGIIDRFAPQGDYLDRVVAAQEKAEQGGLIKNHQHDAPTRPPNREQHANFMGALKNGHEHGVHHTEHTDEHGEEGSTPTHGSDHSKPLKMAQVFAHGHRADLRSLLLDLLLASS